MAVEWFKATIAGETWPVILGTAEEFPQLEEEWGHTDRARRRILIGSPISSALARLVAVHEIFHATFSQPGEDQLFAHMCGVDAAKWLDIEEALIVILAQKLVMAGAGGGLLFHIPPLPEECVADTAAPFCVTKPMKRRSR